MVENLFEENSLEDNSFVEFDSESQLKYEAE